MEDLAQDVIVRRLEGEPPDAALARAVNRERKRQRREPLQRTELEAPEA